jgi:hypothetical protein
MSSIVNKNMDMYMYIYTDRDPVLDADTVMSGKRIFKNTYKIELS